MRRESDGWERGGSDSSGQLRDSSKGLYDRITHIKCSYFVNISSCNTGMAGVQLIESETGSNEFNEPVPGTYLYRNANSVSDSRPGGTRRSLTDILGPPEPDFNDTKELPSPKVSEEVVTDHVEKDAEAKAVKLNWFDGVMVPCLLNIWGVIMFLRLSWVVGQAGIILGIAVITLSNVVTTITALSLCAIVSNGEVKGGGAYFLISRALGPTYGGVIGLLFFCAQAVASSMYVIGFSDSIVDILKKSGSDPFTGDFANDQRVISMITMVALLMTAYAGGAGLFAKAMNFLLGVLIVSLCSLVIGAFLPAIPDAVINAGYGFVGFSRTLPDGFINQIANTTVFAPDDQVSVWLPNFSTDPVTMTTHGFFSVFAVFFPAVTGIMAGANMSGDLEDPSNDIPKGTLSAIVVTYISYCGLAVLVGVVCLRCSDLPNLVGNCPQVADADWAANVVKEGNIPQGGLLYSKLIVESISVWGPLVYVGVFAATLSSALASLVGAPRILQSLAGDGIFPWKALNFFAKGNGPSNEPLRGYVLTFFVGLGCCLIGQLDVVAPIISNFFMISYGITNYACFAATYSESPGWRPAFKYYNQWLSLFGAVLCLVVMFLMDWVNSLLSGSIGVCIYLYLQHIDPETHWGPAGEARKYMAALKSMETLQAIKKDHVKTYRPQFLVMCGSPPAQRMSLVKFAHEMRGGHGVYVYGDVVIESKANADATVDEIRQNKRKDMLLAGANRKNLLAFFYENADAWGGKVGAEAQTRAFCDVVTAGSLHDGFLTLLQLGGLGRLRPNIVLLGFKKDWKEATVEHVAGYEAIVADALYHKKAVIIYKDQALEVNRSSAITNEMIECGQWREEIKNEAALASHISLLEPESDVRTARTILTKQKGLKRIDVWYLGDDGGLTLLIPYLLQKNSAWKDATLNVCQLTHSGLDDEGQTVRLTSAMGRMVHLLKKFRIEAGTNTVDGRLSTWPKKSTIDAYKQQCLQAGMEVNLPEIVESQEEAPKIKALRILRFSEILRQESKDADMVFIQLPIPERKMKPKEYQSYLSFLSVGMPNICFIRGNNENVMTIYS